MPCMFVVVLPMVADRSPPLRSSLDDGMICVAPSTPKLPSGGLPRLILLLTDGCIASW